MEKRIIEKRGRSFVLFKTSFIAVVLTLFCTQTVFSAVVIQEVYPDPVTTDTGGEAVLLYNDGDIDVSIGGWIIGTDSSATDATLPSNATIAPKGAYLVADAGWALQKDNTYWANASYEEAITLRNSPGSVSLRNSNLSLVDNVSYPAPVEGTAYWRDNSTLLIATDPIFSYPLDALYPLRVSGNTSVGWLFSGNLSVLYNGAQARTLRPLSGKTAFFSVNVESPIAPFINWMGQNITMDRMSTTLWSSDIPLTYNTAPGVRNLSTTVGMSTLLEVLPLLAVESDAVSLSLGNTSAIQGDSLFGTGGPTIRNSGNVPISVFVSRTSVLRNGTKAQATINVDAGNGLINVSSKAVLLKNLSVGESAPLSINVESDKSGGYSTQLLFQLKQN